MYSKVNLNIKNLRKAYTIDTDGVVFNVTDGRVLKGTSISKQNRYVKIHLDKFYALHRLVAEHFLPNPDPKKYTQVNHIDGNRYNNAVSNLEWCTPSHNVLHAFSTQLKKPQIGETNGQSKLTETQVRQVWALRNSGLTARQIRDRLKLNVSIAAIKLIRLGKSWAYLTRNLD